MSLDEKILAASTLQAQSTQELAQEESKDRKLIEHIFEVLNWLVPKFQAQESASSSSKLKKSLILFPRIMILY